MLRAGGRGSSASAAAKAAGARTRRRGGAACGQVDRPVVHRARHPARPVRAGGQRPQGARASGARRPSRPRGAARRRRSPSARLSVRADGQIAFAGQPRAQRQPTVGDEQCAARRQRGVARAVARRPRSPTRRSQAGRRSSPRHSPPIGLWSAGQSCAQCSAGVHMIRPALARLPPPAGPALRRSGRSTALDGAARPVRPGHMPWDVLHQGLAGHTGWSFGTMTIVVGGAVVLSRGSRCASGPGSARSAMWS